MIDSVQEVCSKGITAYATTPRTQWVLQWPGQVVLAVSAIYWTQDVSAAMAGTATSNDGAVGARKGALAAVAARCTTQLEEVVELVRGELSNLNRSVGSPCLNTVNHIFTAASVEPSECFLCEMQSLAYHYCIIMCRATLSALVVMDVHARDVVDQLATEGIEGQPQHFSWLSQLRMYWEDPPKGTDNQSKTITVRMMNAQVGVGTSCWHSCKHGAGAHLLQCWLCCCSRAVWYSQLDPRHPLS